MKRVFLFGLLCAIASIMCAQTVQDNELAIVYYMPQTQLCFDVEYEKIVTHKGPFAEYAEQYLGTTDIVEADETTYRLTGVKAHTHTVADYTRVYKVTAEKDIDSQLLTLTSFGTLKGYNLSSAAPRKSEPRQRSNSKQTVQSPKPDVMPLLEEYINGKSVTQQAQGAAKLIYRIRENRMYLLAGEVDHAPADGKAMQLVLDELNNQEQQLVELFVGRREITRHHKTLCYTPVKTEEVEIGYFSEAEGFTTAENGEPILLNITARRQAKGNPRPEKENKKAPQPSQIFYNLPGSANYKVLYLNETITEQQSSIAQFGIAIPLSRTLFTNGELPRIIFDTQTGGIKSIEK